MTVAITLPVLKRIRAALEPFAAEARSFTPEEQDGQIVDSHETVKIEFSVGDFRFAKEMATALDVMIGTMEGWS